VGAADLAQETMSAAIPQMATKATTTKITERFTSVNYLTASNNPLEIRNATLKEI